MRFRLRAISSEGRIESLDLQAFDEATARRQVERQGYTVLAVRRSAGWFAAGGAIAARFPVQNFSEELLVLLNAGLSLVESIETLAEKERRGDFRAVLERIAGILREGRPLSSALVEFPPAFSPLYVATVRASERTGDLAPALARFVAYQSQVDAMRKRVVNASIYPLLLLSVGGLVSLFLLFYVVPRFAQIYEDRTAELPVFSRMLLSWGQLVEGHGILVIGTLVVTVIAAILALRRSDVRAAIGNLLWQIPAIGERAMLYQLARFYRTAGMLLRGGTPLVPALDMARELLHPALHSRLAAARRAISEGRGVADAMEANGLVTAVALRMLVVGEQSGNMHEMMERIAIFHDEELGRWAERFTRTFEPVLMALIGLVIGAIVILMYMPIFELAGNLR
jgi:general secretion pathway protein F